MNPSKYRLAIGLASLALATGTMASCSTTRSDQYPPPTKSGQRHTTDKVRFHGTITKQHGDYKIKSDRGTLYDPLNLPEGYRKAGMRVVVYGETEGSKRSQGQPLEIHEIGRE